MNIGARTRQWIPFPGIFPIHSFVRRLISKWRAIARSSYQILRSKFRFAGATLISVAENQNALMRLNQDCPLGLKGALIELPQDKVIYESVRLIGAWQSAESEFLRQGLLRSKENSQARTALVDIGANTGLISLQAMNRLDQDIEVFLFEPVPRHVDAIRRNLSTLQGPDRLHIYDVALSYKEGIAQFYTEVANHGNTSVFQEIVPVIGRKSTSVRTVDTQNFFEAHLTGFDKYVIKCDTQGMDALILSRIPESIWNSTQSAVVEVWAHSEIREDDVRGFLNYCLKFPYRSWDSQYLERIEIEEIAQFWLGRSGAQKNLFLSVDSVAIDLCG